MNFTKNCRKIVCVGRNFADHAKELNNPIPTAPILFLKPPSSFVTQERPIEIPYGCKNIHHEVELGLIIGKTGRDIKVSDAMSYVKGYFLGLDMTAREIQEEAKKNGHPWSVAKGYDTFSAVSDAVEVSAISDVSKVRLWLKVNGKDRQNGHTNMMLFNIPELISHISTIFTLEDGDTIFTGTPAGVGAVVSGDVITAGVEDEVTGKSVATITFGVVSRPKANL